MLSPLASQLLERGKKVADFLSRAWCSKEIPADSSLSTIEELGPILLRKGCGGLGWWKIRHSKGVNSSAALALRNAWRLCTLQALLHETNLVAAFRYLRSRGVEPLLAKGWAVSRLYPSKGMRPFGDLDLLIPPGEFPKAASALADPEAPQAGVELHSAFRELPDRTREELFDRSRLIVLKDTPIRILAPEDHLRLLTLHSLHHGIWRPLWLCDLAVFLESLPDRFDWDLCMRGQGWHTQALGLGLGLAVKLLAARGDHLPGPATTPLPDWLVTATLREWGKKNHYMRGPSLLESSASLPGLVVALRRRWPNPIRATYSRRAPLDGTPRLPYQLAECWVRTGTFLRHLSRHPLHRPRSRDLVRTAAEYYVDSPV